MYLTTMKPKHLNSHTHSDTLAVWTTLTTLQSNIPLFHVQPQETYKNLIIEENCVVRKNSG